MNKRNVILVFVLLLSIVASAQDVVVNKMGQKFDCYISREDSSAVFFRFFRNEAKIDTFIVRSDLANYQYNATCAGLIPGWDAKFAFSGGFGFSGSTYAGIEFEYMLSDRFGIQVGGGGLGAGAGINYHFAPTIRSSYLTLQYLIQGIGGDSDWGYRNTLIGPAIVFRGRSWFAAQIGVGYVLDKGPAFDPNYPNIPVILTVGIGAYIPLK